MAASPPHTGRPLLAFDTGSPEVSVAIVAPGAGRSAGEALAERSLAQRESSKVLLRMVDECLAEAGLGLADLGGLVALQGPGSFTGLRVGLATVQGLHQATGLPATAVPTLAALAACAPAAAEPVVAVVDALQGGWYAQGFRVERGLAAGGVPRPLAEPERLPAAELAGRRASLFVGFGAVRLSEVPAGPAAGATLEPPALAAVAARLALAGPGQWDLGRLTAPLYLRAPAVTVPGG